MSLPELTDPPTQQMDAPPEMIVDALAEAEPTPSAIDVGAPKSVDVPDEPGSSLWIGLAVVVAAIVLLIWYTNRGG